MAYIKTAWVNGQPPAVNATNLNNLETQYDEAKAELDAHAADTNAQDVGGTGTAITITLQNFAAYTDNYVLTFIAAANNGGAATTININALGVKPVYKPNTTTAPNFIAGKAYTVWYDATGGNFFWKASAEGTAVAGDVLAGETFSNDSDTGITGTLALTGNAVDADVLATKTYYNNDAKTKRTGAMPNRAGDTAALSSSVVGTTLKLRASNGFRDGVDDNVTITDPDFVASKIVAPNSIFGLTGTYAAKHASGSLPTTLGDPSYSVIGVGFQPKTIALRYSGDGVKYEGVYANMPDLTLNSALFWNQSGTFGDATITITPNTNGFDVNSGAFGARPTGTILYWEAYDY